MSDLTPYNGNNSRRRNDFLDTYHLFDTFFNDSLPSFRWSRNDNFRIDLRETDKEYLVDCDLPGFEKDDINVEYDEGRLTIAVNKERENENENEKENYIHRERSYSSLQRSIYLKDSRGEGIDARFLNGVLQIKIPKVGKPGKANRIMIH